MLIGDLGAAAGLPTKTIRFYEKSGLLPAPPRTSGGYRDRTRGPQSPPAPLRDFATSCFSAGGIGRLVLACQSICSSIGPCVSCPFGMAWDCLSTALIAPGWGGSGTRAFMYG